VTTRVSTSSESLRARGILAARHRDHGAHHPLTRAAEREYRSEAYLAGVRAAVADAPPLSAEQRSRLRAILTPVTTAAGVCSALPEKRDDAPADTSRTATTPAAPGGATR
jgi:hypothetical protein